MTNESLLMSSRLENMIAVVKFASLSPAHDHFMHYEPKQTSSVTDAGREDECDFESKNCALIIKLFEWDCCKQCECIRQGTMKIYFTLCSLMITCSCIAV